MLYLNWVYKSNNYDAKVYYNSKYAKFLFYQNILIWIRLRIEPNYHILITKFGETYNYIPKMHQSSLIYLHTQLKLNIMELQDILRIQQLVNEVNKVQKQCCLITEIGTDDIDIFPTDEETLHEAYIGNIIKYTEAIGHYWLITTDKYGLRLHCF